MAQVELKKWTSVSPWFVAEARGLDVNIVDVPVVGGRGSHSSTFRFNVSALCGMGGALRPGLFRGCS